MAGRLGFRLTGVSTPVLGVSWTPTDTHRKIIQDLFSFLEDRRVLYNPLHLEVLDHVVQSVIEMRHELTRLLARFDRQSDTTNALRAMRAACRRFLDAEQAGRGPIYTPCAPPLFLHLGELRSAIGLQLARLAVMYGIEDKDIEPELLSVFPADDDDAGP